MYDKLEELSGGFKNMIQKFDGDFPVSHLKWTLEVPKNPKANASTSPPEDYIINIKINPNKLNRPDISIARTMVHELIHAEMWRKVMSLIKKGTIKSINVNEWKSKLSNGDYPGIFDYYTKYGVKGYQHEQMAAHYRSTIVEVLKKFEPSLNNQTYEALAWAGLQNTVAWNELPQQDKIKITNILKNHKKNGKSNCK